MTREELEKEPPYVWEGTAVEVTTSHRLLDGYPSVTSRILLDTGVELTVGGVVPFTSGEELRISVQRCTLTRVEGPFHTSKPER